MVLPTGIALPSALLLSKLPANIYLFKVNNRKLEKYVKYIQS